jgi:hypothetical protein
MSNQTKEKHIAHIERCERDKVCWMCGDPLEYVAYRMTQHGIRRVMCDHCEREEFGD